MWLDIQSSCYLLPPTGFQDQDCKRSFLGGREGLVEKPGFISQSLAWGWASAKGMLSVSIRLFWLLVMNIILRVSAKIWLCWDIALLSMQSRPVGRTRCTLQCAMQSPYHHDISVCYGSNLGTFLCHVGVHGVCFLHVYLSDTLWHACKRCSVSLADLEGTQSFMPDLMHFQLPAVCGQLWWSCAKIPPHNVPVHSYTHYFSHSNTLMAAWHSP